MTFPKVSPLAVAIDCAFFFALATAFDNKSASIADVSEEVVRLGP